MNKSELLILFHEFFNSVCGMANHSNNLNFESFPLEGKHEFDLDELTITNSMMRLRSLYHLYNVIVLRDYNGEEELVIGCGNYPLANCSGYAFEDDRERKEYHAEHHHTCCYTINPCPAYNPSVIGTFSANTFKNIPDHSFKHIDIEGVWLDATETFWSEIKRLLKEGGTVSVDDETFIAKKDGELDTLGYSDLSLYLRI